MIATIVSGGQTGVDRAGIAFARAAGLRVEGFCPADYWAEDGAIPPDLREGLTPTLERDPAVRTRLNLERADATLVIARGELTGGTLLTVELCRRLGRPYLVISPGDHLAVSRVKAWLARVDPTSLNVAGPRASEKPGIERAALALLRALFNC